MKKITTTLCLFAFAFVAFAKSPLEDVNFGSVYSRLEKITSDNYKNANLLISTLADKSADLSVKLSAINLYSINFSTEKLSEKYLSKINIKKNKLKSKATYEQLIIYSYLLALENPGDVSGAKVFSDEACKKNKNSFASALIASLIAAQNFYNSGEKEAAWYAVNSVMQRPDWTYDMNLSAAMAFSLSVLSYKKQNDRARENAAAWFKGIYGNKVYVEALVDVAAQNALVESSSAGTSSGTAASSTNNSSTSNSSNARLPYLSMEEATEKDEGISEAVGALPGKFSVSPSKTVRFSKGVLVQNTKTKEFSFADEQILAYTTRSYYSQEGIETSFPRYGSGYKDLSKENTGNKYDEEGLHELDVIDGTNFDWGVFCKIKNGGNREGLWRLLSDAEIYYLLFERKNSQSLVSFGYIDLQSGLILLPDDWQGAPSGLNFTPWNEDLYVSFANNYTHEEWQRMEDEGAVFLESNNYWLSSAYVSQSSRVTGNVFYAGSEPYIDRATIYEYMYPRSVRLVQDAGEPVAPESIIDLPKPGKSSVKISEFPTKDVLCVLEGFYMNERARKIVFYNDGTFWCPAIEEYEFDVEEDAWLVPNRNRKYQAVGTYRGNPLKDDKISLSYYDKTVGQEILKRKSDGHLIDYIDVLVTSAVTLDCIYKDGDKKTGRYIYESALAALMPQQVTGTPGSLGNISYIESIDENELINPEGMTVGTRFRTPTGWKRVAVEKGSYQEFLRNYKMYPSSHVGKYQSGSVQGATQVLEMDFIGNNIQECADVAMRLRCEYLFSTKQYEKISFHTSASSEFRYLDYVKQNNLSVDEKSFRAYLEKLMAWAGSLSVDNYDTEPVAWKDVRIGDIIIVGGTPGHVVTIADMALCSDPDMIALLVVQGFQPVQETEVVRGNWIYIHELEPFTAGIEFTSENIKRYKK